MSKRISISITATGEGTLEAADFAFRCLGQPGRQYPMDLTVTPADKSLEHWSEEFQVLMKWCVLIWGQKGIYIHEGPDNLADNDGPSAGCIHLRPGHAKQLYDWLDQPTRILIDYPWSMRELDVATWSVFNRLDSIETRLRQVPQTVLDAEHALTGTTAWSWGAIRNHFGTSGCSQAGCPFNGCSGYFCCALNLSDALISTGYALPTAVSVNYCPHLRVRNADGMARICNAQNGGRPDASGWAHRPNWKGIVYFEGNLGQATGHIDLWDGQQAVHAQYPAATTVWFWKTSS